MVSGVHPGEAHVNRVTGVRGGVLGTAAVFSANPVAGPPPAQCLCADAVCVARSTIYRGPVHGAAILDGTSSASHKEQAAYVGASSVATITQMANYSAEMLTPTPY